MILAPSNPYIVRMHAAHIELSASDFNLFINNTADARLHEEFEF